MRHPKNKNRSKHALLLHLPVPMHRQLKDRAEDQQRSVSAHLRYLIERDLNGDEQQGEPEEIAA